MSKKRIPIVEILVVIAIIGILAVVLLPLLAKSRGSGCKEATCVNNLKQLGLVLNMYANENDGKLPPIDNSTNNFMFDGNVLYPEYLSDVAIVACPSDPNYDPNGTFRLTSNHQTDGTVAGAVHPDCITGFSYVYLGCLVTSDVEAEQFFEIYDELSFEDFDEYIEIPVEKRNAGGSTSGNPWADVNSFLLVSIIGDEHISGELKADAVPVIWDRPYTDPNRFHPHDHETGEPGGNLLYLDGHVEFIKYGEKFPMTETMARLLEERPREPIPDCDPPVADLNDETNNRKEPRHE